MRGRNETPSAAEDGFRRGIEPKPRDVEFEKLIASYKNLVKGRAVTYPVFYQFVKELGHGRQGVVFLATRHCSRGCVTRHALKLFDPSIYSSAQKYWTDMGRIASQISLLQPLNNAHLAAGDLYEECNGVGYLQMHAIDGIDLQFLLNNRQIKMAHERSSQEEWADFSSVLFQTDGEDVSIRPGFVLYILRGILRGLSVLHETGFIHGDIKPTNIMLDVNGMVRIVDFGRAVRIGEEVKIFLGSPLYMAPEIHALEPGFEQSDLFSVGMLALELLKGRQISNMSNLDEKQLLEFKTGLKKNLSQHLPESVLKNWEFMHLLSRFLDIDPARRFKNAEETEIGEASFASVRQWFGEAELNVDYEFELQRYLEKLVDPDTDTLNPHFASDNLTAVIMT